MALNHTEAIRWYRKAIDQGNVDAQFNLGFMYDTGQGVPHSRRKITNQGWPFFAKPATQAG